MKAIVVKTNGDHDLVELVGTNPRAEQFARVDTKRSGIHIRSIAVERLTDEDPDLSHLKQSYNEPSITSAEAEKYKIQDDKRLDAYDRGDWYMMGVRATADVAITPKGSSAGTLVTISSGGLWGIESDSGESYFKDVERDELDELEGLLLTIGVPKKEVEKAIREAKRK